MLFLVVYPSFPDGVLPPYKGSKYPVYKELRVCQQGVKSVFTWNWLFPPNYRINIAYYATTSTNYSVIYASNIYFAHINKNIG